MSVTVSMKNAKELTLDVLKAGLVPFLQSSPGIGKSAIAKEIAEDNKLKLIDVRLSQLEPTDLSGFPKLDGDKACYVPMNLFPIETDPIPNGYRGWLCLLDEANSASMAVQASAYRLILDREVGNHKLHPKVAMMAAGNKITDKAIVNRISTALQSRVVHLDLEVDQKAWSRWADKNGIDHRVKSYIHFKPGDLHAFDPNHQDLTFACPRTWEFASKLIKPMKELQYSKLPLIAGTIGEGMARQFVSFCEIYEELPTIQQILKNPKEVRIADEPSIHYAVTGLVAHHMTPENADVLMKFIDRLEVDFQVITLRSALARDMHIRDTNAVNNWIKEKAEALMSDD